MLEVAQDRNFGDIEGIYEYAKENGYAFYGLTASTDKGIKQEPSILFMLPMAQH